MRASLDLCERAGVKSNRMRSFLAQGVSRLAVARDGPRLLGFVTVMPRPAEHFARVDFLATAPESRRTGVASALLNFVRDETSRAFDQPGSRYDMVVVEAHPDLVPFFGRRGARVLHGVPYEYPSEPPVPAALMALPVRPGPEVPRAYLTRMLTALFEIEGRAPTDPLLARLLARLPAKATLRAPGKPARPVVPLTRAGRTFQLRPYVPTDFDAVREHDLEAALQEVADEGEDQQRAVRETWLAERTGEFHQTPSGREPHEAATVLVLVDPKGGYAGHIWWETVADPISGARMLWIQSIAITKPERRRGWGSDLLDRATAEARALGLRRVGLSVHAGNAARALYERKGYQAIRLTMELDVDKA